MNYNKFFITGIGTDIGKSWATGWLANHLLTKGKTVITQKFIQTGNIDMSEDIILHRKIMGISLQEVDLQHITCPVILSYPASPHFAAMIDNSPIDMTLIDEATKRLASLYDIVLIEGAGGIMVPISENYLTIDYVAERNLPAIVVTNGKLGSISDTLLTLEVLHNRRIPIAGVIYNPYFDNNPELAADARNYMMNFVRKNYPDTEWWDMES